MIKVFIDTDIVLDLFLDREPYLANARKIFQLAHDKKIKLFSSVTTYTNCYYVLSKLVSNAQAKEKLVFLEKRVTVLDSKQEVIKQALFSRFSDFEGAIQHFTAVTHKMDVLLTGNLKDYKNAVIAVQSSSEFLL